MLSGLYCVVIKVKNSHFSTTLLKMFWCNKMYRSSVFCVAILLSVPGDEEC